MVMDQGLDFGLADARAAGSAQRQWYKRGRPSGAVEKQACRVLTGQGCLEVIVRPPG